MKITIQGTLRTFDGQPLKENYVEEDKPKTRDLTAFNAIRNAVLATTEEKVSGEQKYKLYCLAKKLEEGEIDLTSEQITQIKQSVGAFYAPIVVGQIYDLLEGEVGKAKELKASEKAKSKEAEANA